MSEIIDLYDESGKIVGQKSRESVDPLKDILKTVNVIVLNSKKELYMTKPAHSLWPGKWASSAAGIVRQDQSGDDAAMRTVKKELGIVLKLISLGESFYDFDGIKFWMSTYYGTTTMPVVPNPRDVAQGKWMSVDVVERILSDCYPTFQVSFKKLKDAKVI